MPGWKIKVLGKSIPVWVLGAALTIISGGAAAGPVLSGNVQGTVPTAVSQALTVESVGGDVGFGGVSDDGTQFTAAAEIVTGEQYRIDLHLANNSSEDIFAELALDIPIGLTIDVDDPGSDVTGLTRTGLATWKMKLASGATGASGLVIVTVAHADDAPPGFYEMYGILTQTAY